MTHGRYKVTGVRHYRGHMPGEEFTARIEPRIERWAVNAGLIALLERVTPSLVPGSYRLPPDWLRPDPPVVHPRRREAPLSLKEG